MTGTSSSWVGADVLWHNGQPIREDAATEQAIIDLKPGLDAAIYRRLFPYKVKLKTRCIVAKMEPGHVWGFARTKTLPTSYPIQVLAFEGDKARFFHYNSSEAEVLLPRDSVTVIGTNGSALV